MPAAHPAPHPPAMHWPRRAACLLSCAALLLCTAAQAQWGPVEAPPQPWVMMGFMASLPRVRLADFGDERPSTQTRRVADLVVATGDHKGRPFFIVDQLQPRLYAFSAAGRLLGASSILVSGSLGDDPAIAAGLRGGANAHPGTYHRVTPGRFEAQAGRGSAGEDLVWVDHDKAIALHRVAGGKEAERRAPRRPQGQPHPAAWGSINVPAAFYDTYVNGVFRSRRANIYVIPDPDARPVAQVFHWPGQPTPLRRSPAAVKPGLVVAAR